MATEKSRIDFLGVIVPFRNRHDHLNIFIRKITKYLIERRINHRIIIVEQDNEKEFNRGKLLNIGFEYAEKLGCNYVVFHDVDLIPIKCDYSYSNKPTHLANGVFSGHKTIEEFDKYFGGVTIFPTEIFRTINGYSNKYWGWGFEDDDLLLRCEKNNVPLDTITIKNTASNKKILKFNGEGSYVKGKNEIDFREDLTIFVSFHPDDLVFNHEKDSDVFTVFSIPGYDFSINYNSFFRYTFSAFDNFKKPHHINSKIKVNYKTNIVVRIDVKNGIVSMYQDGELVGKLKNMRRMTHYNKKETFYLGVGDPTRTGDERFFRGSIDSVMVISNLLTEEEIEEISKTSDRSKTKTYTKYFENGDVRVFYDSKKISGDWLIDQSSNENHGEIIKCRRIMQRLDDVVEYKVPYRRPSEFFCLGHEENGFLGLKWKNQTTRWNQLRFHNEVSRDDSLLMDDGLSDLSYREHSRSRKKNVIYLNVGL